MPHATFKMKFSALCVCIRVFHTLMNFGGSISFQSSTPAKNYNKQNKILIALGNLSNSFYIHANPVIQAVPILG